MEQAGWLVIRVIADHIHSRQAWLMQRVAQALRDRADSPAQRSTR
jgi:hypothetical protein